MARSADPILMAILEAAVDSARAHQGWMVAERDGRLEVVAAAGGRAGDLLGATVPSDSETVGLVLASGSPVSVAPGEGDENFAVPEASLIGRVPSALLCVPCTTRDSVVGAIELVDRVDGAAFELGELELVMALAGVAGVALTRQVDGSDVPAPSQLGARLESLAASDPGRYATVASALGALLLHA